MLATVLEASNGPLMQILLALAAVIVTGRTLAWLLAWLRQPPVMGEVLGGILLGPSLLGWISREWLGMPASPILPPDVAPYLSLIAQLGVILYMFLVGLEFNTDRFRKLAKTASVVALSSLTAPFILGLCLAVVIHGRFAPSGVSVLSFSLFVGISLSVTAFPVLARILTDRGMTQTELGMLALSCAALGDVLAWWLLALVAGVVQSEATGAVLVVILSVAYVAFMLFVARPIAARLIKLTHGAALSATAVAVTFAALLVSALATEWIGIHAVFGAFVLGVIIPHDSHIARSLKGGLEQVVLVLLLPAFFAYTGMRTEIGLITGWQQWLMCGVIILVASLGKFGGTLAAARLAGLDWRTSSSLGILMNTRGLMELIVLNIGLDLGVISPTLFAMLVLMALATTLATTPLLELLEPNSAAQAALAPIRR